MRSRWTAGAATTTRHASRGCLLCSDPHLTDLPSCSGGCQDHPSHDYDSDCLVLQLAPTALLSAPPRAVFYRRPSCIRMDSSVPWCAVSLGPAAPCRGWQPLSAGYSLRRPPCPPPPPPNPPTSTQRATLGRHQRRWEQVPGACRSPHAHSSRPVDHKHRVVAAAQPPLRQARVELERRDGTPDGIPCCECLQTASERRPLAKAL